MNNVVEIINAVAPGATVIALAIAIWQIILSRKQAQTDFEDGLDREYREIIHNIPIKAFLGEKLDDTEYQEALPYLYRYIDLFNQQVFLRQLKRVGKETWKYWRDGIKSNLSRHPFDKAWQETKAKGQQSFSELKRLENSGFRDDPSSWGKPS